MEQNSKITPASPRARRTVKWVVVAFFVALGAVIVNNLPRGYSDDLSRIGNGTPALVLVRDKNAVASFDQLEVMDGLRGHYAGKIEFLLTDYDTPEGEHFMQTNQAPRVSLTLFDAGGALVKILPPQTAASLARELDAVSSGDHP